MIGRVFGAGLLALCIAGAAGAQTLTEAPGGTLRWLDKITGDAADITLSRGQSEVHGRLTVQLDSCRYPIDNPASDAVAHLTILDAVMSQPLFTGWMVASSPALSAMDHARYDVWVLRCDIPESAPATPEGEGE